MRISVYAFLLFVLVGNSLFSQSINDLIPKNESFFIQSYQEYNRSNKGFWDIPGGEDKIKEGADIQVYELSDRAKDRRYMIENSSKAGYVRIHIEGVAGYIDIKSKKNNNGQKIHIWGPNNDWNQNFSFKYIGNGRFKIYNEKGKVICLSGRNSSNKSDVCIWDDHEGPWMEWYLIDAETNKPFIPQTKQFVNNNSDPVVVGLINEIDQTYSNIKNTEAQSSSALQKLFRSNKTAGNGSSIAQNVSDINSRVNDTQSALNPFSRFPIIGAPVKVLSTTLGLSLGQISKADNVLKTIKEPVLDKTSENVNYALITNILVNNKLNYLKIYLEEKKQTIASSEECKNPAVRDAITSKIKNELAGFNSFSQSVNGKFNSIGTECNKLNKLDKAFDKFDNGLNKFDNGFKKVDKVADEINEVLDKRFKKEIAKVKINISVRDVLEGGKVGKLFDKYVNEFVKDAFKPLMNKLNEKLPAFPEADELKDSFRETLDVTKKIRTESEEIEKESVKINVSRT
ncbi:MAG TPA: hypothetical protein PL041_11105 [Melioribacteraceae bacterium]|nr:hypothetical protein [Melioribacteraceae bacterium]